MPEDKQRVKRVTLAQIIADYIKRYFPNAEGSSLVKRRGKVEVYVKVKEGDECP